MEIRASIVCLIATSQAEEKGLSFWDGAGKAREGHWKHLRDDTVRREKEFGLGAEI